MRHIAHVQRDIVNTLVREAAKNGQAASDQARSGFSTDMPLPLQTRRKLTAAQHVLFDVMHHVASNPLRNGGDGIASSRMDLSGARRLEAMTTTGDRLFGALRRYAGDAVVYGFLD
jgi:hypothetical protein